MARELHVSLPRMDANRHRMSEVNFAQQRRVHLSPRIVVAEDDDEMRRLITVALRKCGYDVTEVSDGGRLLVTVLTRQRDPQLAIDLIVSDLRMPISSGLQILKALRHAGWNKPFILLTAFGQEQTRQEAAQLGALFVDKPFAVEELLAAVEQILLAA